MTDDSAGRHRAPAQPPKPAVPARSSRVDDRQLGLDSSDPLRRANITRLLTVQQVVMTWINTAATLALVVNQPGTSPAMLFLRATGIPLPGWGGAWALVVVLLLGGLAGFNTQRYAHVLAFVLWTFTGAGAVLGLATQSTTSPSASLMLTGLITGMAGWHTAALLFRRRLQRLS